MQIRLEISDEELQKLQKKYEQEKANRQTRLPFAEWAGREVTDHFSQARSQKAAWAVSDTLRPPFTAEIERRLREINGNELEPLAAANN